MTTRLLVSLLTCLFCLQTVHASQALMSEIYLGSREGDPASIVENVSTIHGDYTEVEVDVTVSSPDTLILSRFYSSRDTLPTANFGGWRFNPQCFLKMEKDPKGLTHTSSEGTFERLFAYVGNPDGTILTYVGWNNISQSSKRILLKIDPEENLGIANTAKGDIGAWTNLKNNALYYNSESDSFELHLCNEGKRFYVKNPKDNSYIITHEILSSGNKIFYEFNSKNQLQLIKQTNASEKKVLAWIKMLYGDVIHIETSDKKNVDYHFQQDPSGARLLTKVIRSDKPALQYHYQVVKNYALLKKKVLPEGRFVQVNYMTEDAEEASLSYKVQSVTMPDALEGTSIIEFSYDANSTLVEGPGCRKTNYRFDENFQLVTIQEYLKGSVYRVHQKAWGKKKDAGNLISSSIADGCGNIFYHKYLSYDGMNKGHIIEEREYGDIAGKGAIPLLVDEKGLVTNQEAQIKQYSYFSGKDSHGFFQRDAKGTGIKYWYKKGTNLLVKKCVLTQGSFSSEEETLDSGIKQRFLYDYNEDAALIKVAVDDGKDPDRNSVYGARERKITYIFPKQEMPNVGVPAAIQQKCGGTAIWPSERLINKTVNHFDDLGNISAQEMYDAEGQHRYTLHKQYLDGLLISETDPIGNKTEYAYDANQNLTMERSIATGSFKEYGYDLRNRLISTTQKDKMGNPLEKRITYDANGYKSGEIDLFRNSLRQLQIVDSCDQIKA